MVGRPKGLCFWDPPYFLVSSAPAKAGVTQCSLWGLGTLQHYSFSNCEGDYVFPKVPYNTHQSFIKLSLNKPSQENVDAHVLSDLEWGISLYGLFKAL